MNADRNPGVAPLAEQLVCAGAVTKEIQCAKWRAEIDHPAVAVDGLAVHVKAVATSEGQDAGGEYAVVASWLEACRRERKLLVLLAGYDSDLGTYDDCGNGEGDGGDGGVASCDGKCGRECNDSGVESGLDCCCSGLDDGRGLRGGELMAGGGV
jgi:hypothetical protein